MRTIACCASLALLHFPLLAQESQPAKQPAEKADAPAAFVRGPLFRITCAGPKVLQQAILPTNLGAMLGDERFAAVLDQGMQLLAGVWAGDEGDWQAVRERLLGYSGTIEFALHAVPYERRGRQRFHAAGHIVMAPDGKTDLLALAKDGKRRLLNASGEQASPLKGGDGKVYECIGTPDRDGITLPAMHKGHLVMYTGDRLLQAVDARAKQIAAVLQARTPSWKEIGNKRLVTAQVDLQQVAQMIKADMGRSAELLWPQFKKILGVDSWDRVAAEIGTLGPHLRLETAMHYIKGDRGIFAALLPQIMAPPPLISRAPVGDGNTRSAFVAAHIRGDILLHKMLEFALLMRSSFGGGGPATIDEMLEEGKRELGFHPSKDFVAALGSGVMLLTSLKEQPQGEEQMRNPDMDGLALVVEVKDNALMAKTWQKLRVLEGLTRGDVETLDGGLELVPARVFDRGESIGYAKGFLFWASGPRGRQAIIDFVGRKPDGGAIPEVLAHLKRHVPAGYNGAGLVPARILRDSLMREVLWEVWKEFRYEVPRQMRNQVTRETLGEHAGNVVPILKKYRLDRLGLFTASQGRTSLIRLLW